MQSSWLKCRYIIIYVSVYILYTFAGVFYYLLANIRPVFRSSLQSMQLLLAVAKAEDIHFYGCDTLLAPFVEKMKLLARVSRCS